MINMKKIVSLGTVLGLCVLSVTSVAQINPIHTPDVEPDYSLISEQEIAKVQFEQFAGKKTQQLVGVKPYICVYGGCIKIKQAPIEVKSSAIDEAVLQKRHIRTEDGLDIDIRGNRRDSVQDQKDSSIRGIGKLIVDTSDKYVMLDDTLIYEDFDVVEQSAPVAKEVSNKKKDKDLQVIACGLSHYAPQYIAPEIRDHLNSEEKDNVQHEPKLFPNPARPSDLITITTGTSAPATIQVLDMSGKVIEVADNVSERYELQRSTTGTYFVMIIAENGSVKHKKLLVH